MMAQRRQLDMFTKGRIVRMLESSRSQTEVSRTLNVDQSVISRLKRLKHAGLYARRPAVCIPLTSAHKRARLNWSLKHQHWSLVEWASVMFSDESGFRLSSDSRRAGIMMDGHTDLHFFDTGSVTAQRYRDKVLEPYIRLFRGAVGPDFIFMGDNAPCHRAVLIDDFLETENIQRIS
ncbi:transposable element Tcb2 transposase [Trichonephila clavipes]|nr:transposable element Tcb2 transposase [Trichonephila clavipes]